MVETKPGPGSAAGEALKYLTAAPSMRAAIGLLIMVASPVLITLGLLKPSFRFLFGDDSIARLVRYLLQVALLIGIPYLVIRRMRLYESRIREAAVTRIVLGAILFLLLADGLVDRILRPLLGAIVSDAGIARAIADSAMIPALLIGYAFIFGRYEKREIKELARRSWFRELGIGFGIGILMPTLTVGLLYLTGHYTVVSVNPISVLIFTFVAFAFISCQEELFFRGVVYRISEETLGTHIAVVVSAFIFAGAHLLNENATPTGILSAMMGGALLGLLFSLTKRLWIPISFHLAWNLTQVFFGSNVSGVGEFGSFLVSRIEGPNLLTGGPFGIESSVPLLAGLLILFILTYLAVLRKGQAVRPGWARRVP